MAVVAGIVPFEEVAVEVASFEDSDFALASDPRFEAAADAAIERSFAA